MQISDAETEKTFQFFPGTKVRYLPSYGETQTPQQWATQPYRVLKANLSFSWVTLGYTKYFHVQRWDVTDTGKCESNGPIFVASEHQLELWKEEELNV